MSKVYLGLGSNLGDKKKNITNATMICGSIIGTLEGISSLYETEPWGFDSANKFLNAVICIETNNSPERCLAMAKAIEREMARRRRLREEELIKQQEALRMAALKAAEQESMTTELSPEERARLELQENAARAAKERPEEVAKLIRTWLNEE